MRKRIKSKTGLWTRGLMAALPLCLLLGLSGCSAIGGKSSYPEVEKYLKSRYGGKFRIEEVKVDGDLVCYQVTQKDGEGLTFEVFPVGDGYTKAGFDDTCPVAFVQRKAEEMGLSLEPGTEEKELVATVESYGELEELAGKLAEIAAAYKKADLPAKFTQGTLGDGWNSANIRVEIRDFAPEGYQPGVIRIPDSVTGFHDKESMEQYLEENYLTYLDRYYLGEFPGDVPEEAFQAVREDKRGITIISGDKTTEYPDLEYNSLYFAQVYRMAKAEGWEPEAEGNSFTLSRGEENFRFELAFEEREDLGNREEYRYSGDWTPRGYAFGQKPVAYWYPTEGAAKEPAASEYAEGECISAEILEQVAGVEIEAGLKLQDAQERVQEIQKEANGYRLRSDIKGPGETTEIADWRITLNQWEEKKRLETDTMYYEAEEGRIFVRLNLDVENLAGEKRRFIETVVSQEDLLVHLVTSGGHRYIPVDLIGMSELTSASVEPGVTENGVLIFHITEEILQNQEEMFLAFKAGGESRVFRLP